MTSLDNLPINPSVIVSVTLPSSLFSSVQLINTSYGPDYCVVSNPSAVNQTAACAFYSMEVIAEKISFKNFTSQRNFTFSIVSLTNPNMLYDCSSATNPDKYYVRIIDGSSSDLLFVTSPLATNCLSFVKTKFNAVVSGPLSVFPGQSYAYTLTLEKPGHATIIKPVSSTPAITFDPTSINLNNYTSTVITFNARYRADILAATNNLATNFLLNFTISKNSSEISASFADYYLPIYPLTIAVLPLTVSPTVTVSTIISESVGFDIKVPVTLSVASASTIYLSMVILELVTF